MSRLNIEKYSSLNESIANVQNPEAALQEALDYTSALETVILSLCEELDLDPEELVEDAMTMAREREHVKKMEKQGKKKGSSHKVFGKGGKLIKGIKSLLSTVPVYTPSPWQGR